MERSVFIKEVKPYQFPRETEGRVCAVIVTYYPDHNRLLALIKECLNQCDEVIMVNNGLPLAVDIHGFSTDRFNVIEVGINIGLAAAQNRGVRWAAAKNFTYVLFFDQDSLPRPGLTTILRSTFERLETTGMPVAAVGPSLVDHRDGLITAFVRFHSWGVERFVHRDSDQIEIECDFLISSGLFTSITRFLTIGQWEEGLFIDNVDLEWSFRARAQGFRCYGVYRARLDHRLGDQLIRVNLFRKCLTIYRHAPLRQYYIMRNRIALYRRSYIPISWKIQDIPRAILKFILFSLILGPRWRNLQYMMCGIRDGWRGRMGRIRDQAHQSQ
jgi:rhamnosyltransferase